MQLSPSRLPQLWHGLGAKRGDRAIIEMTRALTDIGVTITTTNAELYLRAHYRTKAQGRVVLAVGMLCSFLAFPVVHQYGWGPGTVANQHPATPRTVLITLLCLAPEIAGLLFLELRGRHFGIVRDMARAISACGDAYRAEVIQRPLSIRQVAKRCQEIRRQLLVIGYHASSMPFGSRHRTTHGRHGSEVSKRLWQAEARLGSEPMAALGELAETLATIADRYAAGYTSALLPDIGLPTEPVRNSERIRTVLAVLSAGAMLWLLVPHLGGAAQPFAIVVIPALSFACWLGIDRGLSLLSRFYPGSASQPSMGTPPADQGAESALQP
ncbi:hypothetical protein [Kitasatospora sp. NRRL B-11411]|uniref:hypothetical protein n=1 Tax=Kitasatospora sp. NRRL B-11411 TaxID=1463822 RepID=UPI0004C34AE1|nr:hypothetical protein [Kitasatospora sp. NRRL B-11411]